MSETGRKRRRGILVKLFVSVAANAAVASGLSSFLPKLFTVSSGAYALLIIGVVLTAVNQLVVPLLSILALPLRAFAAFLAFFAVNIGGLYVATLFLAEIALPGVELQITGGVVSWIVVSLVFGAVNGVIRRVG